jgi:hypothetical protein
LDGVIFNDLMENIEWFFNLHDKNKDGYLTKDEVLTLCESFLVRYNLCSVQNALLTLCKFIFRFEIGDAYLGAVSRFMTNAFEYGDALLPQPEGKGVSNTQDSQQQVRQIESNQPYLNLATCVHSSVHVCCA